MIGQKQRSSLRRSRVLSLIPARDHTGILGQRACYTGKRVGAAALSGASGLFVS
jgi:hypothetical protein